MKLKFFIPLLLGMLLSFNNAKAQDVAIKTNLLYDATATVKAIAVLGGTTSDVASKTFTKS